MIEMLVDTPLYINGTRTDEYVLRDLYGLSRLTIYLFCES